MRKFRRFILACFIVFFISCRTTRNTEPVTIPDIEYPDFPVDVDNPAVKLTLEDNFVVIDYTDKGNQIKIPFWFWLRLVEYSIDVDSAIQQYKAVVEKLNR